MPQNNYLHASVITVPPFCPPLIKSMLILHKHIGLQPSQSPDINIVTGRIQFDMQTMCQTKVANSVMVTINRV